jgi:hypothetical protein
MAPAANHGTPDEPRRVLARHNPRLAGLPLRVGWHHDTETRSIRIGSEHVLQVSHNQQGAPLLGAAARWLSHLAPRLPLPVPLVTAHGLAG